MLWKIIQDRNIGALNDSKLQNVSYFVVLLSVLQFAECIPFAFTSRSRERLIAQWENNSFSSFTMLSVLAVLYKLNRREFIAVRSALRLQVSCYLDFL